MLHGFSCNGRCLSWIEFLFVLSMWAYILVYPFEFIEYVMEAMVIIILAYILMIILDVVGIDLGVYLDCCISVVLNEKLTCKYYILWVISLINLDVLFEITWSNTLKIFNLFRMSKTPHMREQKTIPPTTRVSKSSSKYYSTYQGMYMGSTSIYIPIST